MVKILDTTLRDGSYVVDFQFSQQDTYNISKALESFGIDYIEVGHGLGLGAYRINKYKSLCNDEEYIDAIKERRSDTKYGVFFILGIGNYEDIDLAVEKNIDFIRIGTNINETEKSYDFIKYAKSNGLEVFANFMKSYAVSPKEFAQKVKNAWENGADCVYLVDSAGGMLPNDVKNYILEAKSICDCKIGFHGHNNLTLAIANSLTAIESGATIVDTSLQGIGRDGGNASTEVLLSILIKQGLIEQRDLNTLLDYSELNILPLLRNKGIKSMPLISGIGLFHSGFYPIIKKYADKNNVDPRDIIVKLSKINVIEPKEDDIEKAIRLIKNNKTQKNSSSFINIRYSFKKNSNGMENKLKIIIEELIATAKKQNKKSVFNIVITKTNNVFLSDYIQVSKNYVIASCQINSEIMLEGLIPDIDGKVDIVLYDGENKLYNSVKMRKMIENKLLKSKLFIYNDTNLWVKAMENYVLVNNVSQPKIYVNINNELGKKLYDSFKSYGFNVSVVLNRNDKVDFLIGIEDSEIDNKYITNISKNTVIIDAGIGSVSKEIINYCHQKDIKILRVDMRIVLESEIIQKDETYNFIDKVQGRKKINDFYIVAGGYYGKEGDIVVDSINKPSCVIGIADGQGKVKYMLNNNDLERVKIFENNIKSKGSLL